MAKENPIEAIASPLLLFLAAVRPFKIASSEKSAQGNICDTGKSVPSSEPAPGCNAPMEETCNKPLKRWISRDPIEEYGGINLYAYVQNSPVIDSDRLGLSGDFALDWPDICKGVGFVAVTVTVPEIVAVVTVVTVVTTMTGDSEKRATPADDAENSVPEGHSSKARPSTEEKHEKGDARRKRDGKGEKGDKNRPQWK